MSDKVRYPVCALGSQADTIVMCTDGSVWQLVPSLKGAIWVELPPIPGSEHDRESKS